MRFLNIKTDYAFKKVFGSDDSKEILKSFLNSTLELPYLIKNVQDLDVAPAFKDPNLKKAVDIANTASMSKEELELQFKREEFIFMQKSSIEKAKREGREEGLEKGREEGREEGREKGREEGIEEGFEKGREERNMEIARNLKNAGVDSKTISSVTGLSTESIERA